MTQSRDQLDASLTNLLDEQETVAEDGDLKERVMDESAREALEVAREGRALLKALPTHAVPLAFERRVRQRVRRRTGGRYFSPAPPSFGFGLSIDAFVVLAVAIMAACWFLAQSPQAPSSVLFPDPPSAESNVPPGSDP